MDTELIEYVIEFDSDDAGGSSEAEGGITRADSGGSDSSPFRPRRVHEPTGGSDSSPFRPRRVHEPTPAAATPVRSDRAES